MKTVKKTFLGIDVTSRKELYAEIDELTKQQEQDKEVYNRLLKRYEKLSSEVEQLRREVSRTPQRGSKGRFVPRRKPQQ